MYVAFWALLSIKTTILRYYCCTFYVNVAKFCSWAGAGLKMRPTLRLKLRGWGGEAGAVAEAKDGPGAKE